MTAAVHVRHAPSKFPGSATHTSPKAPLAAHGQSCQTLLPWTLSLSVIGRQCHIQPSGNRSAPVFSVTDPYLSFVVSSFVESSAKVPIMSVAWHEQSSPLFKYSACSLHSWHAQAIVSSGMPGPLLHSSRLCDRRRASTTDSESKRAAAKTFIAHSRSRSVLARRDLTRMLEP